MTYVRVSQMPDLTRVAVVRPKFTTKEQWTRAAIRIGFHLLYALFLMLILGAISPWHPGYWTTVLALYGVQILRGPGDGFVSWTWEGRKSEAGAR